MARSSIFSLGEHSEAKVKLYSNYLSIYLNILARAGFAEKIFIFDLLCGEGIYADGKKGSPIIALEKINDHYQANNQKCPTIAVRFNDSEKSEIEPNLYKIDRVQRFAKEIFKPPNVEVRYSHYDFREALEKAKTEFAASTKPVGLFFIDPYGYKIVTPNDIKEILALTNTEVLLFLPSSFMYRFAEKSLGKDFPGSEPLRAFLQELFQPNIPTFSSVYNFIAKIKEQFKIYLGNQVYVDTFTLQNQTNIFSLFFFHNKPSRFCEDGRI